MVKSTSPIDGRSSFSGVLAGIEGENVLVDIDGQRFSIPYGQVKRANVKGKIDFGS